MKYFLMVIMVLGLMSLFSCKNIKKLSKNPSETVEDQKNLPEVEKPVETKETFIAFEDPSNLKKAQVILYLNEIPAGKTDGLMKEQTRLAIEQFQEKNGLSTGMLNQVTFDKLGVEKMDFDVKDIQSALTMKGFDPGPIDNFIGPMTRSAYMDFLKQNKMENNGFTESIKTALFSDDPAYNNKTEIDPLFESDTSKVAKVYTKPGVKMSDITIPDLQKALRERGYDPGTASNKLNQATRDALYRYQIDKKLPMGDLNTLTLQSLGFD